MRITFPTREQLDAMSISRLRGIDIAEKDEELLVQEIINRKTAALPPDPEKIKSNDVPDISTPEEEEKWQKILDERRAAVKARSIVNVDALPEDEGITNQPSQESVPENAQVTATDASAITSVPLEDTGIKCEVCGSKSSRHKKDCPEAKANKI
jgi:hypothetical protein